MLAVLWGYKITPKHSIILSPFQLSYGAEVALSTKFMLPSSKIMSMDTDMHDQTLSQVKALVEELREQAIWHILKYHEDIKQRYDTCIKKYNFRLRD